SGSAGSDVPRGDVELVTPAGRARGTVVDGLVRFRGVPYAAAPTGDLRFAAPAPHPGWSGVRDAVEPGPTPLLPPMSETSSIPEPPTPGDEILNVSITAPAAPAEPLPVYVWVHGGGYVSGSPNSPWFDGATLARSGVVVVTISYRLGVDGFGHIPGAPDNRAVLDCVAALRWVRETIGAVGGDPARVTIGGESAAGRTGAAWAVRVGGRPHGAAARGRARGRRAGDRPAGAAAGRRARPRRLALAAPRGGGGRRATSRGRQPVVEPLGAAPRP